MTKAPQQNEMSPQPVDVIVQQNGEQSPHSVSNLVKDSDLGLVMGVSAAALLLLVLFGVALFYSGLIDYPDIAAGEVRSGVESYFNDALAYRERRVGLAFVLRTFLTGFSFIVGLALCTMGGVFILRQVSSLTEISGNVGGLGPSLSETEMSKMRKGQISFQAYSPGIVFLIGGVAIMAITQVLAIPINTVEVTPPGGVNWCLNSETGAYGLCSEINKVEGGLTFPPPQTEIPAAAAPATKIDDAMCNVPNPPFFCKTGGE